jgi:cyclohexanone monooxygenase
MKERGFSRVEADREAEERWVIHNDEVANATLYPKANSWYMGANIEGKPKTFMPYVGGVHTYNAHCNEVAARGYEGFTFATPAPKRSPVEDFSVG